MRTTGGFDALTFWETQPENAAAAAHKQAAAVRDDRRMAASGTNYQYSFRPICICRGVFAWLLI